MTDNDFLLFDRITKIKSVIEEYGDNCGFDFDIMTNEFMDKMKYCPNCGAEM